MKTSYVTTAAGLAGLAALAGGIAGGAGGAGGPAQAAHARAAAVTVTITADGTDMSGEVRSARPARCAAERTVNLFRLVRGEPHLWVSDTTSLVAGRWVWSSGNTGTEGRFFAKVPAKPGCRGDVSPAIRVTRD